MGGSRCVDGQGDRPDDRGVSKVVGVVLMVAIVIALASTVAVMVTGFSGMLNEPPPQANIEFTFYTDEDFDDPQEEFHENISATTHELVAIEHEFGDRIDPKDVIVYMESGSTDQTWRGRWTEGGTGDELTIAFGDTLYPAASLPHTLNDGRVQVLWYDDDNDRGIVLGEWYGPNWEET